MIGHRRRLQLLVAIYVALGAVSVLYERAYGVPEQFWLSWTYWAPMAFTVFLIFYILRLRCRICRAHQVVRGASIFNLRWPDERCYLCNAPMKGSVETLGPPEEYSKPNVPISSNLEFWQEAERRRNLFFQTWVGWLLAGPILLMFYMWALRPADEMPAMMAALFTWGAYWYWTSYNLTRLRCPECGGKAFHNPFFFMRHARCASCGAVPKSD